MIRVYSFSKSRQSDIRYRSVASHSPAVDIALQHLQPAMPWDRAPLTSAPAGLEMIVPQQRMRLIAIGYTVRWVTGGVFSASIPVSVILE